LCEFACADAGDNRTHEWPPQWTGNASEIATGEGS
jgi:hypothetical protein